MSRHRDQIAAALGAVRILGPTRYAWLGRGSRPLPASLEAALGEDERRRYLVSCLREELYTSFYCQGGPVPARWGEPEPSFGDPRLIAAMSEANTGMGSWETGWTVERVEGDEAIVASTRLRTRVLVTNCRTRSGALHPGAAVSVRLPKELPSLSPGFFTVVSDAPTDFASAPGIVRVYWNVASAGATALVRSLTSRLNADRVPFRLKVADHPFRLYRCDAAVLYLPGDTFACSLQVIGETADALSAHLTPCIPAFTFRHAPGVGLAEDDGDQESFGVRRCAVLAEAIVRAHEHRIVKADGRLEVVAACFAEVDLRIDAPYLEPAFAGRHVL